MLSTPGGSIAARQNGKSITCISNGKKLKWLKLLLPMQGKPGALSLRLNLYTCPNSLQAQQRESSASDSNGVSPYVSNDVFMWSTLLRSPRHAQTGSPFMKEKCRVIFLSAKLARGFICSVGSAKLISLRSCAGSEPQGRSK